MPKARAATSATVVVLGLLSAAAMSYAGTEEAGAAQLSKPAELAERVAAAARPRLFLRNDGFTRLGQQIRTTHRERWEKLKAAVDASLDEAPPEYREPRVGGDATRPGTFNDEMLWQRTYGYKLPGMTLVAALDKDAKYFELARKWALKPGGYPLWGAGIYENTGLAAKHQLVGVSIAYDWLYDRWSPEDLASLRRTLRTHGRILYEAAEGINDRGWWKQEWRQNHAWNGYQALAATAIALAGEEPEAGVGLATALWGGRNIIKELPDDGSYEEGLPYWGYGMEALLRFVEAVRPFSEDDFYSKDYFRNTPLFRLHLAGPAVKEIANFGDGRTTDWHAVETMMLRLASEYRNPETQWLAESLAGRTDIDATCWSLLWYDSSVSSTPPDDQRLSQVFHSTGFAGARTSWKPEALTIHLRSGKADVSHSHLDVNNFLLNLEGDWLLRDYGYGKVGPGYFNKSTIYLSTGTVGHNCLVIGGRNQRTEADSAGVITGAVDTGEMVWWRSDATRCYEGAEAVAREIVLVRPGSTGAAETFVVVRDVASVENPTTFDFMLQPGGAPVIEGNRFEIAGSRARLAGWVLLPEAPVLVVAKGFGDNINVDDPLSLKISAPGAARRAEFVICLVPLLRGRSKPTVSWSAGTLQVGDSRLRLSSDGAAAPSLTRPQ
jgi:hypothetical protein